MMHTYARGIQLKLMCVAITSCTPTVMCNTGVCDHRYLCRCIASPLLPAA
jgi:hypothetical protein